jgi:WD40 repeat protein
MTLITGSADQTAKVWNVQTGEQLFTFNFGSPARAVDLAVGDQLAVITTDPFMDSPSAIHVKIIARDPADRKLYYAPFHEFMLERANFSWFVEPMSISFTNKIHVFGICFVYQTGDSCIADVIY